ncbi:hypothetical protein C343_06451 [Cryptococcus neoformans C23]|uniref:Alpha/beta hydrolase fold-3 domain-containing protein n=1 Tax=Cryptococcus neoformans (strain H99 / ATCC 208821 / CBS 10515 / FGSC 9487) TaxID=235443 RepID=J9VYH9_CRYN9|nr:hypothetical protein CNAG_06243 [Cryptococcus neoformans var. grubii H99]AUB28620.1 hypothetical protein CKF44_06243 [Cryptococcus neoformans var. grubii]OWZ27278.1 hypothetical protein C347_06450 [Cryptococcus neoformans var. grubii AD2-60a]OWZ39241.1 hypothetical protein C343_06451 [Cryptococcus neoformans var. grubii C23]OXC81433.1 hypothetical protein C344_06355 [Cryptococcus neoformans var. grubii AD1-7a]AFR98471.1 hypothetical protein CNAG_06243 [Cryptococcus neoformans var. grubii H9|eukprot:XP_012053228.1 hypothetical protein CNAG_06243 [Cryptococcus neoformans var. grubii H99]
MPSHGLVMRYMYIWSTFANQLPQNIGPRVLIIMLFLELSPTLNKLLDLFTFPIAHFIVSYRIYIAINRRRILANSYSWHRVAARDLKENTLPKTSIKYTEDCDLKKIGCPPFVEPEYSPEVLEKTRGITIRETVPSFWIQKRGGKPELDRAASPGERVIFFIVGGGYMVGHPLRLHTAWSLAKMTNARVFCVNYHKSLSDATAFPCPLLDTLAGIQYLVEQKDFETENIMLCGDSAGANACLALARCLGEMEDLGSKRFGQVGSLCLQSYQSQSLHRRVSFLLVLSVLILDFRTTSSTQQHPTSPPILVISPTKPTPTSRPPLQPLAHSLTLLDMGSKSAGSAEKMYDEILTLYEGMKRDKVNVRLRVFEGAVHSDFIFLDRPDIPGLGWSW